MSGNKLLTGNCHCGNLTIELKLTSAAASYEPRACDCDFCRKHGALYVSDPKVSLKIFTGQAATVSRYRQGAGLAEMIFCPICGVLAGVCYEDDTGLYGAANARIFSVKFGTEVAVSPKQLEPAEKTERWKRLWFKDVSMME